MMPFITSSSRLGALLVAVSSLSLAACAKDVPLYDFPRSMCGETAVQGAPDSSKTDDPSLALATSDGARLYWVEDDYNVRGGVPFIIHSGAVDGSDTQTLATEPLLPMQIEVDDQNVYWAGGYPDGVSATPFGGTAIKAIPKAGGDPRVVAFVSAASSNGGGSDPKCQGRSICPYRMAIDATDIYYGTTTTLFKVDKIRPSDPIALAAGHVTGLAVDATDVYFLQCSDDLSKATVMKLAKNSNAVPGALGTVDPGFNCSTISNRMVLDDSRIYWSVGLSVFSMSKKGGAISTLSSGTFVSSLALAGDNLYWVTSGTTAGEEFASGSHHSLVRVPKLGGAGVDLVTPSDDVAGYNDDSCAPLNVTVDGTNLYWLVSGGILRRPLVEAANASSASSPP